jgi:hypothetical protein
MNGRSALPEPNRCPVYISLSPEPAISFLFYFLYQSWHTSVIIHPWSTFISIYHLDLETRRINWRHGGRGQSALHCCFFCCLFTFVSVAVFCVLFAGFDALTACHVSFHPIFNVSTRRWDLSRQCNVAGSKPGVVVIPYDVDKKCLSRWPSSVVEGYRETWSRISDGFRLAV